MIIDLIQLKQLFLKKKKKKMFAKMNFTLLYKISTAMQYIVVAMQ